MGTGHRRAARFVAAALIAGCGQVRSSALFDEGHQRPEGGGACAVGEERCACYGNGTCNAGLVCGSDLCVLVPRASGAAGASKSRDSDASIGTPKHPEDGGADFGDARASGGARMGSGGAPASGGHPANGGTAGSSAHAGTNGGGGAGGITSSGGTVASDGGTPNDGGACYSGYKFCGGLCTPPAPRVGCALTGCQPCTLMPPANGYVTCSNDQCTFDCLSGYIKKGSTCEGSGVGGSAGAGNCQLSSCPNCGVTFGPACCTSAGKCGCPVVPYVAPTCI